ncbi:MAG: AAA family ATPase [Acidimicrobiia bacterium]
MSWPESEAERLLAEELGAEVVYEGESPPPGWPPHPDALIFPTELELARRAVEEAEPPKPYAAPALRVLSPEEEGRMLDELQGRDPDIDEFLAAGEPDRAWLVPGLLDRGERLILTGPEGAGKSTLLLQLAVQLATGIHPFSLAPIDPVRVLLIDLENSARHVRRQLRPLRVQAGNRLDPRYVVPVVRSEGVDVLHRPDAEWLAERVAVNGPDVLICGPLYKLAGGDPTSEEVARRVAGLLDRFRVEFGVTVLIEAHQPYGSSVGARPRRPYGASLWSRWPDFGLNLSPHGVVTHWRGARDEREWPAVLIRGGEWPWTAAAASGEALWGRIVEFLETADGRPSMRGLASALGASKSSVQRALDAHRAEWEELFG